MNYVIVGACAAGLAAGRAIGRYGRGGNRAHADPAA